MATLVLLDGLPHDTADTGAAPPIYRGGFLECATGPRRAVFNGKLWVFGGSNEGGYLGEVWSFP